MQFIKPLGRLLASFLVILLSHAADAQENMVPGQIILLNQDTVAGFIDYRNWEKNPTAISFQKSLDEAPHRYASPDIRGFMVQDEHYVSAVVDREISPLKTSALEYSPEIKLEKVAVFLQTLIQGSKSLYHLKDKNGKDQFYIWQNSTYQLLVYKRFFMKNKGSKTIVESKKYIGQLKIYLNDCSSIESKLRNIKYGKNSFEKLFLHYYECTQSDLEFHKKTERTSLEVGLITGVSRTSLRFKSTGLSYLTEADYAPSTNVAAGLFLDLILPRNQKKWVVGNEILFTSYQATEHYSRFVDERNYTYIDTEFGYSYLKMNNMARYRYPIKQVLVYAHVGISNGWAIRETNYRKEEIMSLSIKREKEGKAIADTRKYEQGHLLGLGSQYKRWSVEIRYERGNGISAYSALNSTTKRYYFLLKYRL
ncbi:MAG: hypothetical protein RIG62_13305 [Cyclobacteriaceae bacterium]